MNYYNPYFSAYPYIAPMEATRTGLFSRLLGGVNLSSILSGTQKTLNIVNQTIPLVKQATPILKNAKTMFRVMNEFKKVETPVTNNKTVAKNTTESSSTNSYVTSSNNNGPSFFA